MEFPFRKTNFDKTKFFLATLTPVITPNFQCQIEKNNPFILYPFCASGRVERPPSEHESDMQPLHQLAETNSRQRLGVFVEVLLTMRSNIRLLARGFNQSHAVQKVITSDWFY